MLILAVLQTLGLPTDGRVSFEALFRDFFKAVQGFFSKQGCSVEESQDLAQDTFLRAYKAYSKFRGESKPLTWLLTIATNVWRNRLRDSNAAKRDADEVPLPDEDIGELAESSSSLDSVLSKERLALVASAVADLPDQMRRCVQLRVYQEKSYREISTILGVTPETARSQVSLGRARLQRKMTEKVPSFDVEAWMGGGRRNAK